LTEKVYKYDVFLSYSNSDASVVESIAKGLRDGGLNVWFDSRPSTFEYEQNNALAQSRVLLLFVSERALGDDWHQLEKHTVKFRDPTDQGQRFIPVQLDNTPLPDTLRQLEYVEWRVDQATEILARLITVCMPPKSKPTARGMTVERSAPKKSHKLNQSARISTIEFDFKNNHAAYGTVNGEICLIDINNPALLILKLIGHERRICSLDFHSTKQLLLSCSIDRTVKLWDLRSGQCLRTISEGVAPIKAALMPATGGAA